MHANNPFDSSLDRELHKGAPGNAHSPLPEEGPLMAAVRGQMLSTPWRAEYDSGRTMFHYAEESLSPSKARYLKQLVAESQPDRVLDIGMFTGYAAAAMLEGCPTTQVVSLDVDPYLANWVERTLANFPRAARRHRVEVGLALDTIRRLDRGFDLVLIDANKVEYKNYLETLLARHLLNPGAVVIANYDLPPDWISTDQPNNHAKKMFDEGVNEFKRFVRFNGAFESDEDRAKLLSLVSDAVMGGQSPVGKVVLTENHGDKEQPTPTQSQAKFGLGVFTYCPRVAKL